MNTDSKINPEQNINKNFLSYLPSSKYPLNENYMAFKFSQKFPYYL